MPFFCVIYRIYGAKRTAMRLPPVGPPQQPRQMLLILAFNAEFSAPIESTYFCGSPFEAGAARGAGFAATDGEGDLSKQASLALGSAIDLHSPVWAVAVCDIAQIATSAANNLISASSFADETRR
jgi:hypothetical protein